MSIVSEKGQYNASGFNVQATRMCGGKEGRAVNRVVCCEAEYEMELTEALVTQPLGKRNENLRLRNHKAPTQLKWNR